eukprot:scaffold40158_cov15-Tisochrysis_lutea.AAC.1
MLTQSPRRAKNIICTAKEVLHGTLKHQSPTELQSERMRDSTLCCLKVCMRATEGAGTSDPSLCRYSSGRGAWQSEQPRKAQAGELRRRWREYLFLPTKGVKQQVKVVPNLRCVAGRHSA